MQKLKCIYYHKTQVNWAIAAAQPTQHSNAPIHGNSDSTHPQCTHGTHISPTSTFKCHDHKRQIIQISWANKSNLTDTQRGNAIADADRATRLMEGDWVAPHSLSMSNDMLKGTALYFYGLPWCLTGVSFQFDATDSFDILVNDIVSVAGRCSPAAKGVRVCVLWTHPKLFQHTHAHRHTYGHIKFFTLGVGPAGSVSIGQLTSALTSLIPSAHVYIERAAADFISLLTYWLAVGFYLHLGQVERTACSSLHSTAPSIRQVKRCRNAQQLLAKTGLYISEAERKKTEFMRNQLSQ